MTTSGTPPCASSLARVATAETELDWIAGAIDKNLRQIEAMVSGRKRGDRPTDPGDPGDPEIRVRRVAFELAPETYARLRQARASLADEHGRRLDDDAFIAALREMALERGVGSEPSGRARHQIAVTVCSKCDQAWQEGGGVQLPIDAAAKAVAECNAQRIGSIDVEEPARATQDVPPAMVRLVKRRDGNRCSIPGCRSAVGLDVHHLVPRADGGGRDASNLATCCSACHRAIHAGTLVLGGTVKEFTVERPSDPDRGPRGREVAPTEIDRDAHLALVGLGFSGRVARDAVIAARRRAGPGCTLEALIVKRSRRPTTEDNKLATQSFKRFLTGFGPSAFMLRDAPGYSVC